MMQTPNTNAHRHQSPHKERHITSPYTRYFTRCIWYIYCLLQHIIHPCRINCWISTILQNEILWIAHIVSDVCVSSPENNIKTASLNWKRLTIKHVWCHSHVGLKRPTSQLLLAFQYFIDCSQGEWYLNCSSGLEILCVCSLPVAFRCRNM